LQLPWPFATICVSPFWQLPKDCLSKPPCLCYTRFMETAMTISKTTARRFVLGKQGLWPGRRWAGINGTAAALRAIEMVQMDPLNVVARSHDIVLWSRVSDYRPEFLDSLLYQERQFFDYGGGLFIYPMAELPYWRLSMKKREEEGRWALFAADHQELLDEVREQLRACGPLGNRDFVGNERVTNYRGSKDTSLALYYLWLTGEIMIHHRAGFERVYDIRERVAPLAFDYAAPEEEAEHFLAIKSIAFMGLMPERAWLNNLSGLTGRHITRGAALRWLQELASSGEIASIAIAGEKESHLALLSDLPLLSTLESGGIPAIWQPLETTAGEEAIFLAPLDIVSARGRSARLFDFEYLWEVYKPASKRRWGYYTLPILYGDRLVARLDPKLDRATATLLINGFWLEDHAPAADPVFALALAHGFVRFSRFLDAPRLNIACIEPAALRMQVKDAIGGALEEVICE
jgi:uncharacterized protein